MPGFDLQGARAAGYSDGDIAGRLSETAHFDLDGARAAGYSDNEIAEHLAQHPHKPITGMETPAYQPSLADRLFGRSDPTGNANVQGILPSLGDTASELRNEQPSLGDVAGAAAKGLGQGSNELMRDVNLVGGAVPVTADAIHSLLSGHTETGLQDKFFGSTVAPLEANRSAFELPPDASVLERTAHGVGGAAEFLSEAALTGPEEAGVKLATPIGELVAKTLTHATKSMAVPATKSAVTTGGNVYDATQDPEQALGAAAASYAGTTAAGVLPLNAPGSVVSRVLQGAASGTLMSEANRELMNAVLPPELQTKLETGELTQAALESALLAAVMGPRGEQAPRARDPSVDEWARRFVEAGQAAQPEGGATAASHPALEAPRAPREPSQPLLEQPPIEVTPGGEAGTRSQQDAAAARVLQVTPEGEAATPAVHAERSANTVARAEELGLGDDIVANLERLEQRKMAALDKQAAERQPLPALPPPDPTVYVNSGGQAGTTPQIEDYTRAVNAKAEQARQEQQALGYTPDVAAAGARREHDERARIAAEAQQAQQAQQPPQGDLLPIGEVAGNSRQLAENGSIPGGSRDLAPKAETAAALNRRGEAIDTPAATQVAPEGGSRGAGELTRPAPGKNPVSTGGKRQSDPYYNRPPRAGGEVPNDLEGYDPNAPRVPSTPTATEADLQRTRSELDQFTAERKVRKQTKVPDERVDDVLAYVAKRGGIDSAEAVAQGLDPATVRSAKGYGIRRPFKKGGMSFDAAAEMLHEAGYPVTDEQGRYSANKVLDVLDRATRGEKIHSVRNETAVQQAELERQAAGDREIESKALTDRRSNIGERKRVAAMSHEELRKEILTSHLTGLPNKRAYEEADRLPHQAALDVDSLKWVNDNMGHASGDEVLKAVGQALGEVTQRAYHFSGDEFVVEGADQAEIDTLMAEVNEWLKTATVEATTPDGTKHTYTGLGISYGTGKTLHEADQRLSAAKTEREARGLRASRGDRPAGVTSEAAQGLTDHESDAGPAAEKDGSVVRESTLEGDRRKAPRGDDVENVTLKGEGHLSHTTRTESKTLPSHLEGEEPPVVGEEQINLFGPTDARPLTSQKQIELANKLMDELDRYAEKDGDVKTLAVDFNREYRRDHAASLVGKVIKDAKDLATFAQVFRDPRYETLRYFALDENNKIVGESAVSSRLPGSSAAFPKGADIEWVKDFVKRTGAKRLRMLHNHPSGSSTPSDADKAITLRVAKHVGMPVTHVVIDSHEYSVLRAPLSGDRLEVELKTRLAPEGTPDKLLTPSKPHVVLGSPITGNRSLAVLGKVLQKPDFVAVIGIAGNPLRVRSAGEVHNAVFLDRARARAALLRFGLQNGNLATLANLPNEWLSDGHRSTMIWLIENGHIIDAVTQDGTAFRQFSMRSMTELDLGLPVHELAAERGPYAQKPKAEPAPRGDLLGDDTRTKQELADRERAKDAKRSPNKDVAPDTGDPWDLFTTRKQSDIDDVRERVFPSDLKMEVDESSDGEQFTIRVERKSGDDKDNEIGRLSLELSYVGQKRVALQIHSADVATHRRGEGIGQALIRRAYELAHKRGWPLVSDTLVSAKQLRAYEALKRDGWTIEYSKPEDVKRVLELAEGEKTWNGGHAGGDGSGEPVVKRIEPPSSSDVVREGDREQLDTPEFKRWFGDSKVVDKGGAPLIVYHGTNQALESFDPERRGRNTASSSSMHAFFFTDGREVAGQYADLSAKRQIPGAPAHEKKTARLMREVAKAESAAQRTGNWDEHERLQNELETHEYGAINADPAGAHVMPVYLSLQNPKEVHVGGQISTADVTRWIGQAKKAGHDGLIMRDVDDTPSFAGGPHADHFAVFEPEQIKSAIGNTGEFNPDDANVVRESVGDRRETQRRETQRGGRRTDDIPPPAKKGYAAAAQRAIDSWNDKVGWRWSPLGKLPGKRAYLNERYQALGRVGSAQEIGRSIYDALSKANDADKKAVYDYMTNAAGDASTIGNKEVRTAAVRTKNLIDKIGQRLVETGLLSKEAYDAHAGEYLPRVYLKHMLGDNAFTALGNGKRLSDLGYLKRRQDIPEEVRKVMLGEITDPAFLASFGATRTLRDLALVDFLDKVAGREDWTPKGAVVEWNGRNVSPFWLSEEARQLRKRAKMYEAPEAAKAKAIADSMDDAVDQALEHLGNPDTRTYEQIPNSARYGALRGLWVRKEIYDDLVGAQGFVPRDASVAETLFGQGGVITKATQWWKMSKVVLNPPTQIRNFLSNLVLLHLSGVPMHRVYSGEIIGRAVKSLANKDKYFQIAQKYGLFSTTFANQEGARIREEWLRAQDLEGSSLAKMRAFAGRLSNTATDVYQYSESIGKIAKLIDGMEREGKSEADAMLDAHEALFDYSLVPRSVQYLRNQPLGAPFITFMYKALGSMLETATKHPLRFAPYAVLPFLLRELIKNAYDVSSDDLEKLRQAFPNWMRERGHMLLLPFKDEQGRWQVADMGYLAPWGQFADLAAAATEGKGLKELANTMVLSGPLADVTAALETNIDPFTGKQIVKQTDPPADQLQQLMGYVWDLAAPGIFTSQGGINQLRKSLRGDTNVRGEPGQTPFQAALRMFGMNVYPVDPESTRAANLRGMRFELTEKRQRLRELLKNPNLTPAQRVDIGQTWSKILAKDADAIEQYSKDSEINPKLAVK